MTENKQGSRAVDVHTLWKHEALDFTPWLAENLDMLAREIGMGLELIGTEYPVGDFSLDILAKKAGSHTLVAIENQLEWTDHGHLGQLLTYAAGLGVGVAIWVAPVFRHEHAEALHRLNEWTAHALALYGVKVEAIETTAGSQPEPRLTTVVWPGGWNEKATVRSESNPEKLWYQRFFEPLIAELIQGKAFDRWPVQIWNFKGRGFPSPCKEGIWYMASLEGENDAWVTLHISTADKALTKRVFDALCEDRGSIEAGIAAGPSAEWHWRRHSGHYYSSINIRRDGSIADSPERLEEIRTWMRDLLPQFKKTFDPLIAAFVEEPRGSAG